MDISRRTVISGMAASVAMAPAARAWATTKVSLGEFDLFSVSDGNLVLPAQFFFDGLPQDELAVILKRYNVSQDQLEPPCNVTVLRSDTRVVLFDAGAGPGFMPTAGLLLDSLDAIGITPEDVTDVVFTHAHPDHIWGVLDDFDDLVFAEATYWIGETEWTYWRDPQTVNTIGEARAAFAVGAQRRLDAIEPQIQMISPGQEVLPGVLAISSFGHTPGHLSFEVRQGNQGVLIGGDAIGNHHVAFARPDWPSGADQDADQAAQTRARLLDMLAADDTALLGFHLPQGGLGRVERDADAYKFVAGVAP